MDDVHEPRGTHDAPHHEPDRRPRPSDGANAPAATSMPWSCAPATNGPGPSGTTTTSSSTRTRAGDRARRFTPVLLQLVPEGTVLDLDAAVTRRRRHGMRAVVLRGGRLEVRETADPGGRSRASSCCGRSSTAICASDVHFMDHQEARPDGGPAAWSTTRTATSSSATSSSARSSGTAPAAPTSSRWARASPRCRSCWSTVALGGTKVIGQHPEAQGSFGELLVVSEVMAPRRARRRVRTTRSRSSTRSRSASSTSAARAIEPGEIPIVIGAGAIGLSAVAALVARGIEPIVVSDFNADRLELARAVRRARRRGPGRAVAVRRVESTRRALDARSRPWCSSASAPRA